MTTKETPVRTFEYRNIKELFVPFSFVEEHPQFLPHVFTVEDSLFYGPKEQFEGYAKATIDRYLEDTQ